MQSVPTITKIVSSNPAHGVLNTTLYDKVCQWLAIDCRFSLGTEVSSTNKADCYDTAEILLRVVLNTITLTLIIY